MRLQVDPGSVTTVAWLTPGESTRDGGIDRSALVEDEQKTRSMTVASRRSRTARTAALLGGVTGRGPETTVVVGPARGFAVRSRRHCQQRHSRPTPERGGRTGSCAGGCRNALFHLAFDGREEKVPEARGSDSDTGGLVRSTRPGGKARISGEMVAAFGVGG